MKKYALLIILFFTIGKGIAQQWIDTKYEYDSVLNVSYGTAINFNGVLDTLKMDIYTPICDDVTHTSRKPLLILIHGGAFVAGDKSETSITSLCKQFAKRGYVTASINYRLGFISDDVAWNCNYPNYSCAFATDSAEWYRAYYRAVLDGKGALRYLINRNSFFRIDTNNVFVAGESAGSFVALGIALMDSLSERPIQTFAISDVPSPNSITMACEYNVGKIFPNPTIPRPDLGGIDGTIEPTSINYTIKGVGNMYGGMTTDLLRLIPVNKPKPAIYSFHQPCDMVVPIDSGVVYEGLSWCMTNGYGCFGIANTAKVYGSRAFSQWNVNNSYGYTIQDEFTATNFPYNFLFGSGSCADQVNTPCHAYDNFTLRTTNLSLFFAPLVTTNPICDTAFVAAELLKKNESNFVLIYPNPANDQLSIECKNYQNAHITIYNVVGERFKNSIPLLSEKTTFNIKELPSGIYFIIVQDGNGMTTIKRFLKST